MSLAEYVPSWMLTVGPGDLAIWQWITLVAIFAGSYLLCRLVVFIVGRSAGAVTRRTESDLDDVLLQRLQGPTRAILTVATVRVLVPFAELHPRATDVTITLLFVVLGVSLVWAALRAIDVVTSRLTAAPWALARPASRALLSLLGRIGKVIVVVIAGIAFLGALGLPIASLLAGLGIGGIAIAFGAQKTVENLFGAVAIGVDQPLREGDFVKIEGDVLGTVETVGLRSTRVRTHDRTLVTIPNGKLADMRVETFAARDRCRLATTIGLVYGTTGEQLRTVLAGFERVLREHPSIWPDLVIVRFVSFGDSSLNIDVMAWFKTSDWGQFQIWRQEVLIGFMDVVEGARTSFAFPTRTVHIVNREQAAIA